MISPEFLVTALVVVLIPGAGVVFTVSTGLMRGRAASVFAAMGCTLGIIPHLCVGLAAVMNTSALACQALKYAGAAYLIYLACTTWRSRSILAIDQVPSRTASFSVVTKAILLNLLNPKLTIFFLAFLPQFVEPDVGSPLDQLLVLSAVFMLMTFVVFVMYGFLAHSFRKVVIESPRVQDWLRKGLAGAFAGLGIELALSRQ